MHKSSGLGRLIYYFLTDWSRAISEKGKLNEHCQQAGQACTNQKPLLF